MHHTNHSLAGLAIKSTLTWFTFISMHNLVSIIIVSIIILIKLSSLGGVLRNCPAHKVQVVAQLGSLKHSLPQIRVYIGNY